MSDDSVKDAKTLIRTARAILVREIRDELGVTSEPMKLRHPIWLKYDIVGGCVVALMHDGLVLREGQTGHSKLLFDGVATEDLVMMIESIRRRRHPWRQS